MKIAIIGGGVLGLTLATHLASPSMEVTVFEREPQLGGLATWFDYGDFTWDKFYHVICRQDAHLLKMLEELGISDRVRWAETNTGFLWHGRQLSMSNNREFLAFPALSLVEKIRLGAGILFCQRFANPAPLERIKAAQWLTRIFGRNVYQIIWEPLLESKFGALKNEIPATIMWATIRRYYETTQHGGRQSMGFIQGGCRTLIDALVRRIHTASGVIRCSSEIVGLASNTGKTIKVLTPNKEFIYDHVISTITTEQLRKLAPQWESLYPPSHIRPRILGVICLALILRQPLSPFYVTNLIQKGFPFTGIIGISNLIGQQELAGRHMVMLPRYDVPESAWFDQSDEVITKEFVGSLKPIWSDIEQNCIGSFVHRAKTVQAIWTDPPPHYATPPQALQGRIWNVNAELAGRDTLNNNAIVHLAETTAHLFLDHLNSNLNAKCVQHEELDIGK